jgi:hypothetical protein
MNSRPMTAGRPQVGSRQQRARIGSQSRRRERSDDRIRQTVMQIHGQESSDIDLRSENRLAFVYPACVTYPDPFQALRLTGAAKRETARDIQLEAVMTDLSVEGAGILVSARHDPLPRRVILAVDGSNFVCDVRWTKHVGGSVYRYGLIFRTVRENPRQSSRAAAVRTGLEDEGLVGGASGTSAGN